jgi:hypothetical protein
MSDAPSLNIKKMEYPMSSFFKIVVLTLIVTCITSCSTPPSRPNFVPLRFTSVPPIGLNVSKISFVNEYPLPGYAPHIENELVLPLDNMIKLWSQDRLKMIGRDGSLRITIKEASAIETRYQKDNSLTAKFKNSVSGEVAMKIVVTAEILDEDTSVLASVTSESDSSQTQLEDMTLSEREQMLYTMTVELLKRFDKKMEQSIRVNLGSWVAY